MENLYSILDVKQSRYGALMTFTNDATAVRAFQEMLISNEPGSMLSLYPTDYCLFAVGSFNKETGNITPCAPQLIITGYDCMVKAIDEVNRRKKMRDALSQGKQIDDLVSDTSTLISDDAGSVSK